MTYSELLKVLALCWNYWGDLNGKGYEQVTAGVYYLCIGSSVVRPAQKGGLSHHIAR